jgi:hypothetical protein
MLKRGSVAARPRNRHKIIFGVGYARGPLGGLCDVALCSRFSAFKYACLCRCD